MLGNQSGSASPPGRTPCWPEALSSVFFRVEACLVLAPHPAPCEEMKGGCAGMPPSLWSALGLVDPTGGVREPMASVSSRGCRVE